MRNRENGEENQMNKRNNDREPELSSMSRDKPYRIDAKPLEDFTLSRRRDSRWGVEKELITWRVCFWPRAKSWWRVQRVPRMHRIPLDPCHQLRSSNCSLRFRSPSLLREHRSSWRPESMTTYTTGDANTHLQPAPLSTNSDVQPTALGNVGGVGHPGQATEGWR